MQYTDQDYEKMTTYELQLLFGQAVIGSDEYRRLSSILNQREAKTATLTERTLCWSRIAGIAAILAVIATIVFSLLQIFHTSGPQQISQ